MAAPQRNPSGNDVVEVPVVAYNGEACISSGTMIPLSPERLAQRYPTHQRYVQALLVATNDAVADRFLVCEDAETILRRASASTIGGTDAFTATPKCAARSR